MGYPLTDNNDFPLLPVKKAAPTDNDFPILKSVTQQPITQNKIDFTNIPRGYQAPPPTEETRDIPQYQEQYKEQIGKRNEAIDNTLKRQYKNLGITVDKNSPRYKKDFQQKLDALHSGDIVTTTTKSGEPTTTRGAGFFESAGKSFGESLAEPLDAAKINTMTSKELADYLDKKSQQQPEVPESLPSGLSGMFGQAAGGFPKIAALYSIPYVGEIVAAGEAQWSSTARHTEDLYYRGLRELQTKGVPFEKARIQAADAAKKNAPLAAAPDAFMTAALGEMGGDAKGLMNAATDFKTAFNKSIQSVGKFGALGTSAEGTRSGIEKLQGYDVTMQEAIDNMGKGGMQWATMDAMFKIAPLLGKMPTAVRNAWSKYMSKVPDQVINQYAIENGQIGDQIRQEINDYKEADKSVPDHLSEEKRDALIELTKQKNKIEKQPSVVKGDKETQLQNINHAINQVVSSKNPSAGYLDVLTGESEGNPKDYEDLSSTEKNGIVTPKDYGEVDVEQKGEGEEKRFVPKAKFLDKEGVIEIYKPIKIEGEFTDKKEAKAAAEKALAQHYYENKLPDNLKPQKREEKKTEAEVVPEQTNAGVSTGNEPISTEETKSATTEPTQVGKGTQEFKSKGTKLDLAVKNKMKENSELPLIDDAKLLNQKVIDEKTGKPNQRTVVYKNREAVKDETYRDLQNDIVKKQKILKDLIDCV